MDTGCFLQDITDKYGIEERKAHIILHMYGIMRDAVKIRNYSGSNRKMPAYDARRVDEVFPKHLSWEAGDNDVIMELPVNCTANDISRILDIGTGAARVMAKELRLVKHEAFGYMMYDTSGDAWHRMLEY